VQTFGLGKIANRYYIAMEYVHGRDLRTLMRRAEDRGVRLPMDLAVFIGTRIASALTYAHHKTDDKGHPLRIIHRDVSPQNILVSYDGSVKLTDFGIARAVTRASATVHGLLRGKLAYMSPEQAQGKSSPRSDTFSLGVVLYELLTGQRPIQGDSEKSLLQALRSPSIFAPRTKNPRIPESLDQAIMRALSPDPDQRFHDALHLQRALEASVAGHPAATAREMGRFMDLLFDASERGPSGTLDVPAAAPVAEDDFEVDLEASGDAPPPAPLTGHGSDDMSVEKLLKRFRR
jgi:serine/threonine protein kinase